MTEKPELICFDKFTQTGYTQHSDTLIRETETARQCWTCHGWISITTGENLTFDDEPCTNCGAQPEFRECDQCGASAMITDCGDMSQPRPISAGLDGKPVCNFCHQG